jgi:hypothetical protein
VTTIGALAEASQSLTAIEAIGADHWKMRWRTRTHCIVIFEMKSVSVPRSSLGKCYSPSASRDVECDLSATDVRKYPADFCRSSTHLSRLRFPSGESIRDGRNPIAGSAEFRMLFDVNEFLSDVRRRSAADAFRSDAIEQASLHILCGVEIA